MERSLGVLCIFAAIFVGYFVAVTERQLLRAVRLGNEFLVVVAAMQRLRGWLTSIAVGWITGSLRLIEVEKEERARVGCD